MSQVIDEQGNVATYTYDAVGNLLSITRNTGGVGAPTITGLTPNNAPAGQTVTVTISGQNLSGASVATDNPGVAVSNVGTAQATVTATFTIAFTARVGATVVTVSTTAGSATTSFTVNASPPAITALSPSTGPPTRLVTITGTGFSAMPASNQISFNGAPAATLRATPTQLLTQVPVGAATGLVTVTVGGLTSNGVTFTVTTPAGPPPTVTSHTPTVGTMQGGMQVTFTGTNFVAGTTALFGSTPGQVPTVVSPTQLTAKTPFTRTAGIVDVVVTNANGDVFLPNAFTSVSGPNQRILTITPTPGLINIPRNAPVTVSFARPVDRATVTSSTFSLSVGGTPVAGAFTFEFGDTVVTFTPSATLNASTVYTLSLTQGIRSVDGIPIDGGFVGTFATGTGSDTVAPSVTVSPANGAIGVPFNSIVVLNFSEPINPNSINATTIQVSNNGVRNGTLALGGQNTVVTFTPASPFAPGTSVTITVSGLVRDVAGNRLVGNGGVGTDVVTTFTTATTVDLAPPQVLQTNPLNGATGINASSSIAVTFNESVNPLSVNASTFVVTAGGPALAGQMLFSNFNQIATFIPAVPFPGFTPVTLTLNPGIADVAGNLTINTSTSTFLTAQALDNFQPSVISVSPFSSQQGVPLNTRVTLVFDERINPNTITSTTFRVNGPAGQVLGTIAVVLDQLSATFTPAQPLLPNASHSMSYTTGIEDIAGNPLFNPSTVSFTTGSQPSDTTGPSVVTISPAIGASNVPTNSPVVIQFSEPVAATSVDSQTVILSVGGVPIEEEITLEQGNTVVRIRSANLVSLQTNTFYQVTVTMGVTDTAGNPLVSQFASGFGTGASSDTTVPTVVSRSPASGATGVPRDTSVVATFSEAIDPVTVTTSTFRLTGGGVNGNIPGTISVSADRTTVTFMPVNLLFANQSHMITLSNIEDVAGNKLASTSTSFTTAYAAGTDLTALPTAATVVANPTQLFADGVTTTTVTVSNINRSGVLVPNGTVVAVTAEPAYRLDAAGGVILGGTASSADPRFRLFSTLGGSLTVTYQAPNRPDLVGGATASGFVQVAAVDAAGAPMSLAGMETVTLFSGSSATLSANPTSLLANGTSYSEVSVTVTDRNGNPAPAGVAIGVTAEPVYNLNSLGGTLSGGTPAADSRFQRFTTIAGGVVELTYTAPALAAEQSGSGVIQVVELDGAGNIVGLLGTRSISLSTTSGFSAPQPVVLAVSPAHGQVNVGTNAVVMAHFSQSLDPATVTASTFSVSGLAGTRTLSASGRGPNTVVTFTPTNPLSPNTSFTVSITTGLKSSTGNPLLASSFTTFSTGTSSDSTAPTVVQINPVDGATGVATNSVVSVELSEPLNAVTVDATTVTLSTGGVTLSGRITLSNGVRGPNTVITFTPDQLLSGNTSYTVTLMTGLTDPAGNALAVPFTASFTTTTGIDNFQPSVVSVSPFSGQSSVPLNAKVTLRFDERINPLTLTSTTLRVNGPVGQTPGTYVVAADQLSATFTASQPLLANASYSVSYTNGLTDMAGNKLFNPATSSFTTGSVLSDINGPQIVAVSPTDGASAVPINAPVVVQFSESVAATSVTEQTVSVSRGGSAIPGAMTLEQSNTVVRWKPANLALLATNAAHTLTVTTGVTDVAGNLVVAQFVGGFTTGSASDTTVPTVVSRSPASGATGVPRTTSVVVTFSEAIDPVTVTTSTFRLTGGGVNGNIPGTISVSADRTTVTLTPSHPLFANQSHTITLSNIEDVAGNKLASTSTSFTTAYAPGTDLTALPTAATVVANPTQLFADGVTTTTVTVSNINRSGVLVPNGTVVAITAEPAYRLDAAGGVILGGTVSTADPRFRLFSTLGGSLTVTYQSPNRPDLVGTTDSGLIQVASADAAGAPMSLAGTGTITLFSGSSASLSTNPTSLLANGTSYAEVIITVTDRNGNPAPAGVAIGVTAEPVYNLSALGGTLSGGTPAADPRFQRFVTIAGGLVELTYTAPTLATGQSGSGVIQVVELDGAGNIVGLLGTRSISLSATSGFTAPQPVVGAVSPAHGQSGVGTNATVMAQFSQSLDPATVTTSTFNVSSLAGTRTLSASGRGPNTVVTFTPTNPLAPNASFSISITTGIKSASGNPLLASSFTTFSTGVAADTTAPTVVQLNPPNGATGVAMNAVVSVEFAEPINAVTVDLATVTLTSGGNLVSGRVSVSSGVRGPNTIVTFTPNQLLSGNTSYQINLTTGITDPAGNPLAAAVTATFTTTTGIDNFQPSVVSISPFSGQSGVPLNGTVALRFDERINPLTLTSSTFRVNGPAGQTPGTYVVAVDQLSATFTASQALLANSGYSVSYTNGIQDLAGNKLFNPTTISFTTGTVPTDATGPQVVAVSPADGASAVPINAPVVVQFSESVAATSVHENTFIMSSGGVSIPGVITFEQSNTVVRWKPANLALLAPNAAHTLTVTIGVTDVVGNPLVTQFASGFTTGGTSDTTVPTVVSRTPASGATGVPQTTSVVVTFSEAIDPVTVTSSTFRLTGGGVNGNIPGTISVSADRRTVTFTPSHPLFANLSHTLTLSNIEDVAGNKLASTSTSFTTAYAPGTDLTALPTAATVVANPTQLFADGVTTTTVTVSNINRSGVLVPNGTVVAVTAEPAYRLDAAGGVILGGTVSTADPRFRLFSTLGGSLTFTYQSPNRPDLVGTTDSGLIQVASADAAGAPMSLAGTETITLFSGSSASLSTNPTSLLANGTSYAEVSITVTDRNGNPAPAGVPIGVTAEPVYNVSSLGGTITGGTLAADARFRRFVTIAGGLVELTYTAPALASGQTGSGVLQVVELDGAGNVLGLLGTRTISLSATSGFTAPQPVVGVVSPANGQSGVGTNAVVMAQFSQSLDPATVTASTFAVSGPTGAVTGTRTVSASLKGPNTVVTFTPPNPLSPNSSYSVSISTGIKSASGTPLLASSFTTFSTGTSPDTTAPSVVQINPGDGATGVATNAVVSVEFAEPINAVTVDLATVTLTSGGNLVSGRVSVGSGVRGPNTSVTFTPDQLLSGNTSYQINLTTGITDPAGNPLAAAVTATFTTATGIDNFQPSVISVSPANASVDVPAEITVSVTFSEPMNPVSVNANTFFLNGPQGRVPGAIMLTNNNTVATFTPTNPLFAGRVYSVSVTTSLQDIAGNRLVNAFTSSFTTALAPGTANLPTSATVTVNPPSLFANGQIATTVIISNINRSGVQVPNGTTIAVTADPAFALSSAGGTISGPSIGTSVDGRFLLFSTFGAEVTVSYTPLDLTSLPSGTTASGIIQVASVDLDTRPSSVIAQGTTTLFGVNSAMLTANPTTLPADGASTSTITITVKDRDGNLVPDGTRVGLTAAPIFNQTTAGGTIVNGTASTGDSRVQIFTTLGGQCTATYRAPTSRGSGTAVIQSVTVDGAGHPTGLIASVTITLQ